MALLFTKAVSSVYPQARRIFHAHRDLLQINLLPSVTHIANLTSTHGLPAERKYKPWPYKERPFNSLYNFIDNTIKRFDDNTKIILIEGNLAVGKSWFGEKLAKEFDMKFIPDIRDEKLFFRGEGFDLRTLNEQLPPTAKFCDKETFYRHTEHPAMLKSFGRTQVEMYMEHFFIYAEALEHLLNTGQGIVMERGVFSHMVFHNVLQRMGHLTPTALKFFTFMYDNTICEMWRPHLVIYLDASVDYARKLINKRNLDWEVKSPVITDEFLKTVDKVYKEKYLPAMSKYSDVVTYNMEEFPDWEIVVEEIESRDFEPRPFEDENKFKDWFSDSNEEYAVMRMKMAKKWLIQSMFSMSLPWDSPELIITHDDAPVYRRVLHSIPDVFYAKGYNPQKYNVLWKW